MIKKMIIKQPPKPKLQTNSNSKKYERQLFVTYGTVKDNNDDGTCNVLLKNGFVARVRIPSTFWSSESPITGGISYPPKDTEVRIEYPENDLNSGFVYPANINTRNQEVSDAILGQGDKTILPGGWVYTYNQETGEATFKNGENFILEANPDSKVLSLTDFEGNTFKNNGATWEINGATKVARLDDTTSLTLQASDVVALASLLIATGAFVPTGTAPVGTTPIVFSEGKITSGSDKVKVG